MTAVKDFAAEMTDLQDDAILIMHMRDMPMAWVMFTYREKDEQVLVSLDLPLMEAFIGHLEVVRDRLRTGPPPGPSNIIVRSSNILPAPTSVEDQ